MAADRKAARRYAGTADKRAWNSEGQNLAAAHLEVVEELEGLRKLAQAIKSDLQDRMTLAGEDSVELSNGLWMHLFDYLERTKP